ncbi:uncharacterized protein B0I36DRAFT_386851 [Microdochium trichocladiopsis]|uniref:Rhodopsin domain-containing protein n=1 Tax=Microdochium trichocladiopsis TaxID=1682393 RepID=A0A9P9BN59_9PEZI|nr:uncharacterized protein B0I36DRAFT_386851 [Microdochium trichocladiopsis]KAH7026621.1 hypothetical protein B0I36DRAFT_386851 [Microdochium trichocladiopsis]
MGPRSTTSPFFGLNESDHSGVLATVVVVSQVITLLTLSFRLLWSRHLQTLRNYDHALWAAFVLLLVQSGLTIFVAKLGLGKHTSTIEHGVLDQIRKVQYAIWLVSILVVLATKTCICLFIQTINTFAGVKTANTVLQGLIGVFFLSTFLATAFRCPLPDPWFASSKATCSAAAPIYLYTMATSIITDVLATTLAVTMIVRVQTGVQTKAVVIALFGSRIICPFTTIPTLSYGSSHIYNGDETDFTWDALSPLLWLTVTCHLSVITACVPTLKKLFDSLLGNTLSITIDAPYQLERIDGRTGFNITERDEITGSGRAGGSSSARGRYGLKYSKNSRSQSSRGSGFGWKGVPGVPTKSSIDRPSFFGGSLRLGVTSTTVTSPHQATESHAGGGFESVSRLGDRRGGNSDSAVKEQSESVKGLTEGVIMVRQEVDVQHDHGADHDSWSLRDSR